MKPSKSFPNMFVHKRVFNIYKPKESSSEKKNTNLKLDSHINPLENKVKSTDNQNSDNEQALQMLLMIVLEQYNSAFAKIRMFM